MNIRVFLLVNLFLLLATYIQAQVTIGMGSPPEDGAILQLKQKDGAGANSVKGLLLPRVSLSDLDNLFPMFTDNGSGGYEEGVKADLDAAHAGLMVYNVNTKGCDIRRGVYTWSGDQWNYVGLNSYDGSSGYSFDRSRDSLALVALYNSTGGSGWTDKTNWLSNKPITEWAGVTCVEGCVNGKADVAVTGIHFENNNLVGQLPADLKNIVNLTELSLPVGQLDGSIPSWLSDLTKLQAIDLRSNQFSGVIPTELAGLSDLVILDLQNNQLDGPIPAGLENLTQLSYLNLAYNEQLTGTIPTGLGSLAKLMYLDLQYCSFSGNIPSLFSNLINLISINLSGNQLAGDIPVNLLSVTIKGFCPQYMSGGAIINSNPWTNYNCQ